MSERNGKSPGTGTAEIPVVRPATPTVEAAPAEPNVAIETQAATGDGPNPTAPVGVRPKPRAPRRGPLTVMGPWAPVAGGLLGLVLGVIAVLLLGGAAESFEDRLALVFAVLGLGMLGTAGILVADEIQMIRQCARDAVVRPQRIEAMGRLLTGFTPARLLLLVSAFVLFLAAYVSR